MNNTVFLLLISLAAVSSRTVKEKEDEKIKEIDSRNYNYRQTSSDNENHQTTINLLPVRIEKSGDKRKTDDILRHMGMTKVRNPHRKRLASHTSRKSHHHDKDSEDSHVYIIKLPPNKHYYESYDGLGKTASKVHMSHKNSFNRIPINFKSNGKPGKIYHWNLPVVKKMISRRNSAKENNVVDDHHLDQEMASSSHRHITYYKPKKPSKQAFNKYFPNNGKPQSLYVIQSGKKISHKIKQ